MGDFSEDQVNAMLETQAIKLRLDGIEEALKTISKDMLNHTSSEEHEVRAIIRAVEKGANERRKSETELKASIAKMDKDNHDKFVKKTDLKLYAILIVSSVTIAVSVITWVGISTTGYAQDKSAVTVIKQMEKLLDRRLGDAN